MQVKVRKNFLALTLLLLLCAAVIPIKSMNQNCQSNGKIRIIGSTTQGPPPDNSRVGYINMCDGGQWKAICHNGWDLNDARVACREFNFTGAQFCTGSCLGKKNQLEGLINFSCHGNETRLHNCAYSNQTSGMKNDCGDRNHAGILCYNVTHMTSEMINCSEKCSANHACIQQVNMSTTTTTASSPTTGTTLTAARTTPTAAGITPTAAGITPTAAGTTPTAAGTTMTSPIGMISTTQLTGSESAHQESKKGTNCVAEGITLGGLNTILLVILSAVIVGWVWSCHRNKGKTAPRLSKVTTCQNVSYNQTSTSALIPAVQYSSTGPHSPTSTSHAPLENRIYHILEQPREEEEKGGEDGVYQDVEQGEGVYHMLGEAGEGQEEGVYHVLGEEGLGGEQEGMYHMLGEVGEGQKQGEGMVYEVPVQTKSKDAKKEIEKAYSTLQHN